METLNDKGYIQAIPGETLSDKEWESILPSGLREEIFYKEDVKAFIKELLDKSGKIGDLCIVGNECLYCTIKKLAGDKLI